MKKIKQTLTFVLFPVLLITWLFPLSVLADKAQNGVIDDAGFFDEQQIAALNDLTKQIKNDFDFNVYIVSVDSTEGENIEDYTICFYEQTLQAEKENGIIFLITKLDRAYCSHTSEVTDIILSDRSLDECENAFTSTMSESHDDYSAAVKAYMGELNNALRYYEDHGEPYKADGKFPSVLTVLIILAISFTIGTAYTLYLKRCMNTARPQKEANAYIKKDSFQLTNQTDLFLYSTTVRTKIESDSNHSGSAGSHTSSGHY